MIRRATEADHAWIASVAADVYGALGDYGTIIRSWLDHPGVLAYVDEAPVGGAGPVPRGFILVGFYEPSDAPAGLFIADLLAIAVARDHQRNKVGSGLLEYAIHLAAAAAQRGGVQEMRLTVADTNTVAQRFFASFGFRVLDDNHGHYDGGQRAIRMTRSLP